MAGRIGTDRNRKKHLPVSKGKVLLLLARMAAGRYGGSSPPSASSVQRASRL
ncbi:hypothetical protein [Paenibacillus dendritiformis]|uniref:hypothetical protein n=1 Tax=Paenibacillus dendritiformis TaxID=130049 RepID=UPI00387E20D5